MGGFLFENHVNLANLSGKRAGDFWTLKVNWGLIQDILMRGEAFCMIWYIFKWLRNMGFSHTKNCLVIFFISKHQWTRLEKITQKSN